jgi:hypothetical protein
VTGHLALAGVAVVAALSVSACGTDLNPGVAAVVDDTTISQGEVDDLVDAACAYSEAVREEEGGGSEPTQVIAQLRSLITQQLIDFEISSAAVDELGLTVNDSTATALALSNPMPSDLDPDQEELMREFFDAQAYSLLQQAVIGAHQRDESITVADDTLTREDVDAAQEFLDEFAGEFDIEVNPAYGTWDGSAVVTSSGSLSDPVSALAQDAFASPEESPGASADLPPNQVCG